MIWICSCSILFLIGIVWCMVLYYSNKPKPTTDYIFKYYLKGNNYGMPIEFLEEWKLSALENHHYILSLTLEDSTILHKYLGEIWKNYEGKDVIINVYERQFIDGEIIHKFLGEYWVVNGLVFGV